MEKHVEDILCQQLELLAETSKKGLQYDELAMLSNAMCEIAQLLLPNY